MSAVENPGPEAGERTRGGRRLDFMFGVLGTVLQVGTGMLMLPAVAATLPPAALTFWYVFLTIFTLALLIEFGFTPTLARNFTYVLAGARSLRAEGVPEESGKGVDVDLLAHLLRASQRLYFAMATIVLVVLGVGGTIYLEALARTAADVTHLWPAWGFFIAGLTLQTAFNWQGCLMIGADRMRENYQVLTVARLVQVCLSLAGLIMFPSILTLAVAYAVSVLVGRIHAHLVVTDVLRRVAGVTINIGRVNDILRTLAPMATNLGWVTLGDFLPPDLLCS